MQEIAKVKDLIKNKKRQLQDQQLQNNVIMEGC